MLPHVQFPGSSGPVPYTLRVFNGVKWVFCLSDSLPRKIVDCFYARKAAVMIKVRLGLESVVWLGLGFGLVFFFFFLYQCRAAFSAA